MDAAILKGLAVFSVLACLGGLTTVAAADWAMIRLHNDFIAMNGVAASDALSAEARTMILLNVCVVVAIVLNLVAVRLMLRGRKTS